LYGFPKITLSRFDSICSSISTLDLKPLAQPHGGVWNRNGLETNTLDLGSLVNQKVTVTYTYQNPINLCQNSDSFTFLVQAQPEIYLSVPDKNCEGETIGIASSFNNANGMVWSTAGDGVFDDSLLGLSTTTLALTKYWYGQQDFNTTYFNLLAQTTGNGVCEAAKANQRVNVFLKPKLQLSTDINEGCQPLTVNFKLQYQTDTLPTFYWNFGNGINRTNRNILQDFSYTYLNAGNYAHSVLVVTDSSRGACKEQTEPLAVNVYPKPKAAINASKWLTNVADTEIQFYDKSSVASPGFLTEWFWQFGDKLGGYATIQNPIYYYNVQNESDTGDYVVSLQVKTNHDCKDTAENVLTIKPDITVYIPNSFTPNRIGPSRNNQFFVVARSYDAINIKIFNRWGEKLYESTDANEGWDGTYMGNNVPDGVYVYLVEAEAWGKKYRYYGTITLLR
jgi:gliding motility-associated-like protein